MDRIKATMLLAEIKGYLTAGNPVWDVDEIAEACDMAIEALQNLSKPNNGLQSSNLVSRSRAIDGIREYINEYKYNDIKWSAMKEAEMLIESLPSADAVEVVRCKDCKHYQNKHICQYFSRFGTIETSSYAYCSYGERREP